ncbi:hypothetical protein DPMN_158933 [Dreissena polymorpha]|uniref:Uncharacterized protein n=1 Tax=Dreissena polymorpha TaxID=45954 RepID=A0A9D4EKR5_DREPO|nr:hypothetical protein DPMN_158933 [Dreissena polymorpha]
MTKNVCQNGNTTGTTVSSQKHKLKTPQSDKNIMIQSMKPEYLKLQKLNCTKAKLNFNNNEHLKVT